MERRRRHEECRPDVCKVVVGRRCDAGKAKRTGRAKFDCMQGIDPKLMMLAALIVVFSFLVNVAIGMKMYQKWTGTPWPPNNV